MKKYSIICLKDTQFTDDVEPYVEIQWGYTCSINFCRFNARRVSFMFNNNFEFKINESQKDNKQIRATCYNRRPQSHPLPYLWA